MRMSEIINENILGMISENIDIKKAIKYIFSVYKNNGYEIYLVGGAVRDILLGKSPKDYDFATNAPIDVTMKLFDKVIPTGEQHGTVTIVLYGNYFEITIFRKDTETDGRHAKIEKANSIIDDLARRDFSCNAMALTFDGDLIDPYHGEQDLENGIVRFVGNPEERMNEDYLRILRFFRFHGRLATNYYDPATEEAIRKAAHGLKSISGERIWAEMAKILVGRNAGTEIAEMFKLGVAQNIGLKHDHNAKSIDTFNSKVESPITVLGYFIDGLQEAQAIVAHWKLSNPEAKLLYFISSNKQQKVSKETAEDMVVDGVPALFVHELSIMNHDDSVASYINNWIVPVFPVTGQDMIDIGVKPGPDMGRTLKFLKKKWIESRFTLDKDEVLSLLN